MWCEQQQVDCWPAIQFYQKCQYYIFTMRSQRLHLPSFLDFEEDEDKSVLTFKKEAIITLMDMIKQELGNTLNPKFISSHRKEIEVPHFVLAVSDRHKEWKLIKRLNEIIELEKHLKNKYTNKIPSVPLRKESELNAKNQGQMLEFFEVFMNVISKNKSIKEEKEFLKFIENFVPPQRKKMKIFKQLDLTKRAGGRHNESNMKKLISYFTNWTKKHFTITSQGVYYTANDQDFRIEEMIPFSVGFKLMYGQSDTGYTYGIILNSAHRMLSIDAENIFNMTYFVYSIRKAMKDNNYLSVKRYQSFADQRSNCQAVYFIDGKHYFSDVYEALLSAKTEVFITGWMISPFFCLRRPDPNNETRVDKVLGKIANLGIKINIIVYMEPKVALNIDSEFTESYLTGLSPNIKVLRHPAYLLIPFLWSHHQKMIIVDQKVAFVGGLDIGYGRYDDKQHRLLDPNEQFWPGVDYCNYRKTDILKPKQFLKCTIDRKLVPRMPWHDVAVRISGESVIDLSRHFVQFWNYVNFQLNMDERELLMYAGLNEQDLEEIKKKEKMEVEPSKTAARKSAEHKRQSKNYSEIINIYKEHDEKNEKIQKVDVSQVVDEQDLQMDHEEQMEFYANHLKSQSSKEKIEKIFNNFKQSRLMGSRHGFNFQQLVVTQIKEDARIEKGKQKHQFLRSASMWSLGLEDGQDQRSILIAYVELIYHAKQFIYIQNQFFISVQNTISKALIQRISRAHKNNQKFKVVVVLPSLPGFDGEIYNEMSAVMRVQVHYIYNTICRGKDSILERLKFIKNIDDYIQFFTLRTYAFLDQKTSVTELIYVHSKLMIVDDEKVLIGSANINDRSLLGSRDSQIAIVIEDQQKQQIKIHGTNTKRSVRKFAHSLRVDLFMEHFGVTRQETEDYLNEDTWWQMIEHANKNQQIYRDVFGIYPDNSMSTFKDLHEVHKNRKPIENQLLKAVIKGNAVLFQKDFLIKQSLDLKPSQKQYYVPAINFC